MFDQAMLSALKNADNFMICCHINPDGDAIGSLLAAGRLLERLGKHCVLVSPDGLPADFACLPDAGKVVRPQALDGMRIDAALAVDVSDSDRMGAATEAFFKAPLTLQIDHHATNPRYAMHNMIDAEASATGELITALYEETGVDIDAQAAYQLYCAIDSDSGNFCYNSVRPYTFRCMEKLMQAGLDISAAARELFMIKSRAHIAVLGRALTSLTFFADGQATCMRISNADKAACSATSADITDIVNYGLYMTGVRMSFLAEEREGGWKYSLRAMPGYNVADVALVFGGGGHKLAAGCFIAGSFEEGSAKMKALMEDALKA